MESNMLKAYKERYPDKEFPPSFGQKWTEHEENKLLEELKANIDLETIANNHSRTVGGIQSRRAEIAYSMYLKDVSMDEIMKKTKLKNEIIQQIIDRRQKGSNKESNDSKNKNTSLKTTSLMETEIAELKNEIKGLKDAMNEMIAMMKAVYEFEEDR